MRLTIKYQYDRNNTNMIHAKLTTLQGKIFKGKDILIDLIRMQIMKTGRIC